MRILITGGAGLIGSHLADCLLTLNHEVFILDDFSTGSTDNLKKSEGNPNLHIFRESILNYPIVSKLGRDVQFIFHLAAVVGVEKVLQNPLNSMTVNIKGTDNILNVASYEAIPVIMASTSEIYGKNTKMPFKEDDDRILGSTTKSRWSYAYGKAIDEFYAIAYCKQKGLPVTIARFFNVVGERQSSSYGMVIPRFITQALADQPLRVYGSGEQQRCFAYVKDIVHCLIEMMSLEHKGEIYNVGSQTEISMIELAKLIIRKTNSKSVIEMIPYKDLPSDFEDMNRRIPDTLKLASAIGQKWMPCLPIDEILDIMIHYFKGSKV